MKIDIQTNELNDPLKVWRIKDDKFEFEVYIGDHRLEIVKQLNWPTVKCIIEDIDEKTAMERCIADNVCRSNYSAVGLEKLVYMLHQSGKYKSNEEIGNKIGFTTKQRIGQLLIAYEDRTKFNDMLKKEGGNESLQMGSSVILDSRGLINDNERLHLLKLVNKGEIHSTDVKKVCEILPHLPLNVRNKILYQGASYYTVLAEYRAEANKGLKKRETKTITIDGNNFAEKLYSNLTESLRAYLLSFAIGRENETIAINYLKMCVALISEELYRHHKIKQDEFETIRDKILGIYRDNLYGYGGGPLGGVEGFV